MKLVSEKAGGYRYWYVKVTHLTDETPRTEVFNEGARRGLFVGLYCGIGFMGCLWALSEVLRRYA